MAVYVATHKRVALPRSDWLTSIGLNGYRDENVHICDADGADNISHLNRSYGELTGLYCCSSIAATTTPGCVTTGACSRSANPCRPWTSTIRR